jgi:2-haloacid dehalogenase
MRKKYHTLLWDLDNTLLDFDAAAQLSFNDMMRVYDLPSDSEHYELYQEINHSLWNNLENGQLKQDQIKWKRWEMYFDCISTYRDPYEANQDFFKGLAKHPVEVKGARALLKDLQKDFELCLITNGIGEIQRQRLKRSGFDIFFKALVISDEIGHAKPNKAFFDHTFQELEGPDKSTTLVIGDNLGSDIRGGNNFGVSTCWYNEKGKKVYGGIEAKYEINDLEEFMQLLFHK